MLTNKIYSFNFFFPKRTVPVNCGRAGGAELDSWSRAVSNRPFQFLQFSVQHFPVSILMGSVLLIIIVGVDTLTSIPCTIAHMLKAVLYFEICCDES